MTLSKEYVQQLKAQTDLQFTLTLRFMNENPIINNAEALSLQAIEELPMKDRRKLADDVTSAIEAAVKRAEEIAKTLCPITAPMEAAT